MAYKEQIRLSHKKKDYVYMERINGRKVNERLFLKVHDEISLWSFCSCNSIFGYFQSSELLS